VVVEGHQHGGLLSFDLRRLDDEVFDLGVLGVVERVELDGADFPLRRDGVLPDQLRERRLEVGVDEGAVGGLEEGARVAGVLFIKSGDDGVRSGRWRSGRSGATVS
jgi:hypothetical protein